MNNFTFISLIERNAYINIFFNFESFLKWQWEKYTFIKERESTINIIFSNSKLERKTHLIFNINFFRYHLETENVI